MTTKNQQVLAKTAAAWNRMSLYTSNKYVSQMRRARKLADTRAIIALETLNQFKSYKMIFSILL